MKVRAKAPLRLGLAGGGTDVSPFCDRYGGYVLNATIDMFTYCTIESLSSGEVIFESLDRDESVTLRTDDPMDFNGHMDLHKGVYRRIMRDYNEGRCLGCRVSTFSDAPAGSGLGSSSTLVVAMIQAFGEWLKLPFGEYDVAHLAYEVERKDVKINGGKQDQYAAAFGGFNFMEFYENDRVIVNPLRIKQRIVNELESSLVLYFTGVSRDSAKIIDTQTESIKNSNQASIEAMLSMKSESLAVKEALLRGDLAAFAHSFRQGWEAKKRTSTSISNSTIETAYQTAMEAGASAGKVSGAGGGGFMMFVVDPTKKISVVKKLTALGGQIINAHFTPLGAQSWAGQDEKLLKQTL